MAQEYKPGEIDHLEEALRRSGNQSRQPPWRAV